MPPAMALITPTRGLLLGKPKLPQELCLVKINIITIHGCTGVCIESRTHSRLVLCPIDLSPFESVCRSLRPRSGSRKLPTSPAPAHRYAYNLLRHRLIGQACCSFQPK